MRLEDDFSCRLADGIVRTRSDPGLIRRQLDHIQVQVGQEKGRGTMKLDNESTSSLSVDGAYIKQAWILRNVGPLERSLKDSPYRFGVACSPIMKEDKRSDREPPRKSIGRDLPGLCDRRSWAGVASTVIDQAFPCSQGPNLLKPIIVTFSYADGDRGRSGWMEARRRRGRTA